MGVLESLWFPVRLDDFKKHFRKISTGDDPNIPDLNSEHRIGVTKLLWFFLASIFLYMTSALLNDIA